MKYLLLIYGNQEKWASIPAEAIARQDAFNRKYQATGELIGAYALADLAEDKRMARHHRLLATRAHLRELAGDAGAAAADYLEAARRATSLPERRYLALQAARLSA